MNKLQKDDALQQTVMSDLYHAMVAIAGISKIIEEQANE